VCCCAVGLWSLVLAGTGVYVWRKPIPTSLKVIHARMVAQAGVIMVRTHSSRWLCFQRMLPSHWRLRAGTVRRRLDFAVVTGTLRPCQRGQQSCFQGDQGRRKASWRAHSFCVCGSCACTCTPEGVSSQMYPPLCQASVLISCSMFHHVIVINEETHVSSRMLSTDGATEQPEC
jgi:hypothetical protein